MSNNYVFAHKTVDHVDTGSIKRRKDLRRETIKYLCHKLTRPLQGIIFRCLNKHPFQPWACQVASINTTATQILFDRYQKPLRDKQSFWTFSHEKKTNLNITMPLAEAPVDEAETSPETSRSGEAPGNPDVPVPYLNQNPNPNVERIFLRRSVSNNFLDIDEIEENDYPAQAYLLPVVLPTVTEPTLDELLRRITGRQDIENVDTVKLRVISYMVSLCRLSLFMPRLVQLDLSGSVLNSLRDLGCGLMHLTHLNVSNCGLSSFDGTSGIPTIEVLIADGNMIQLVGPLTNLPLLKKLSAKNNRISDLGMLTFLGMCPNLIEVDLQGNPVTNLSLYRRTMKRNIPTLELLDGQPFSEESVDGGGAPMSYVDDTTDAESSLSDEIFSEADTSLVSIASASLAERPSTSGGLCNISIVTPTQRPASSLAEPTKSSLRGSPVVGTVLGIARMRHRRQNSAWGSSSNSSSSSSSIDLSREFPNRLQQVTLPPLPPIGGVSPKSDDGSSSGSEGSTSCR